MDDFGQATSADPFFAISPMPRPFRDVERARESPCLEIGCPWGVWVRLPRSECDKGVGSILE